MGNPVKNRFLFLMGFVVVLSMLLQGCGKASDNDRDGDGVADPYGLQTRPVPGNLNLPVTNPAITIGFTPAFPSLPAFTQPVFLTHSGDGSNRLFVVEQVGRIKVFDNDPAVSSVNTFLDISAKVVDGGEMGLLGLAFDPDYTFNGFFYVYYTDTSCPGGERCSVLARYSVSANPLVANANSEVVIKRIAQPYANHNGGTIVFGADGYLYWGLGDGGSAGDPQGNGQNTSTLLGSLLRIDVSTLPYRIPADNPYVASGDGIADEIWAYGLRNPYRFSFDRATDRLWVADVGQNNIEEIDIIEKGGNYGWNWYEGSATYRSGAPAGDYRFPVYEYDHSLGASITGGYVYRGASLSALQGQYIYADFVSSRVWALTVDNALNAINNSELGTAPENVSSFGEDEAGELYIVGYSGGIYRITGDNTADPLAGFPTLLSDTGLFADTTSLTPASGLLAYAVQAPLWSDYSSKQRWIAVPANSKIIFSSENNWLFPVGTVLVKQFDMEMIAGEPSSARRLETRVLIQQNSGWVGATYRWNPQQTDATLLTAAASETLTIADSNFPSNTRTQVYNYPSPTECLRCHSLAAGRVLGVRTRQLNSLFDYDGTEDVQIRAWNHVGLFSSDIGRADRYASHAALDDTTASLERRARSYLDANCAFCHLSGSATPVALDLRSQLSLLSAAIIDEAPLAGDLGIADARIVASGDHTRSILWLRMSTTDSSTRMPTIASVMPHPDALDVIAQWIDQL